MLRIEEKGIFKVVQEDQLESWTSMGWRLVAVLNNQTALPFMDSEMIPHLQFTGTPTSIPTYGNQYGNTTPMAMNTRHHTVQSSSFLLVLEEENAIGTLKAEIGVLEAKLKEAFVAEATATKAHTQGVATLAGLQRQHTELESTYKRTLDLVGAAERALVDYKAEVADKLKQADEIIARDKDRRRTVYERIVEGGYDDTVESVEAGDVG